MQAVVHATAIALAVDADGPLLGVLLLGASGSGKSSLAISAVESCPWRRTALVADDAPRLLVRGGALWAVAPDKIKGLVELRGFGVVSIRSIPEVLVVVAFDLDADGPRLAEPRTAELVPGAPTPVFPFQAALDAASRLRLAAREIYGRKARG